MNFFVHLLFHFRLLNKANMCDNNWQWQRWNFVLCSIHRIYRWILQQQKLTNTSFKVDLQAVLFITTQILNLCEKTCLWSIKIRVFWTLSLHNQIAFINPNNARSYNALQTNSKICLINILLDMIKCSCKWHAICKTLRTFRAELFEIFLSLQFTFAEISITLCGLSIGCWKEFLFWFVIYSISNITESLFVLIALEYKNCRNCFFLLFLNSNEKKYFSLVQLITGVSAYYCLTDTRGCKWNLLSSLL